MDRPRRRAPRGMAAGHKRRIRRWPEGLRPIHGRAARLEEILGPWKELAFVQRAEPATWRMADDLRSRFDGVRVPSARHAGGVNLVLWRWNEAGGPRVKVFDPNEELTPWPRP